MYTIEKAQEQIFEAERYYANYVGAMEKKESYARATYAFKHPEEFSPYRPAKSATKIDSASFQLVSDEYAIQLVDPLKMRDRDEKDKAVLHLYLNSVLDKSQLVTSVSAIRQFAINLPTYGAIVGKVVYDEEMDDAGELPIYIRSINPKCGYPWGPKCFIVRYRKTVRELEETVDKWNAGRRTDLVKWERKAGYTDTTEIEWVEIEYPEERGIFVGTSKQLDPFYTDVFVENPFGFISYVHKYSGWASEASDGAPEHLARGINDYCFEQYQLHAQLMTALVAGVSENMFGRDVITADVYKHGDFHWPDNPGDPIILPAMTTKEQFWDHRPPELNPSMITLAAIINQDLDDATVYDNIAGEKTPGVGSGVFNSQLLGQGKLKLRVPGRQIELALQELLEKAARIAYDLGPFTINGHDAIRPSNIRLPVNLKVSLEPEDTTLNIQRSQMGERLLLAGAISWRECREQYLKIQNTSGARREKLIDLMLNSPQLIQAFGNAALQEWGLAELAGTLDEQGEANDRMGGIQDGRRQLLLQEGRLPNGSIPERTKVIPQDMGGNMGPSDMRESYGAKQGGMSDTGAMR